MLVKNFLINNTILSSEQAAAISYVGADGLELIDKILSLKYGSLQIGETDIIDTETVQDNVNTIFNMHSYNWKKKHDSIEITYTALSNNNMTSSGTDVNTKKSTDSGSDTSSASGSNTGTSTNVNTPTLTTIETTARNNFNSSSMIDNDKTTTAESGTSTDTRTDNLNNSNTGAVNYGKVNDSTDNTSSNHNTAGYMNTPVQDLIQKERDIAEYNFYEMIADEIVTYICILEYTF